MFWKQIHVGPKERVLIGKRGRFARMLMPGDHRLFAMPGVSLEIERHDVSRFVCKTSWARQLVTEYPAAVAEHFEVVETNRSQIGMVYVNGELFRVLLPKKRLLFWRGEARIGVEMVEVLPEPELSSGVFDRLVEWEKK